MLNKVHGKGINDVKGESTTAIYRKWESMLMRCYSEPFLAKRPSYIGCSVCEEWITFSNFKAWVISQDWVGKHLDKDLLIPDNKIYSPETCIFISPQLNSFILDRKNHRGEYLLGVYWNKKDNKYMAMCSNPFTKKREHLGSYSDELQAHLAWKSRKHTHALEYAEKITNPELKQALTCRYV